MLGLFEERDPIGLCTVFPADRLVDGPGIVGGHREPARYARLLLAACACLGPGPVDVDSWGDDAAVLETYCGLGLAVVEQTGGWKLRLGTGQKRA